MGKEKENNVWHFVDDNWVIVKIWDRVQSIRKEHVKWTVMFWERWTGCKCDIYTDKQFWYYIRQDTWEDVSVFWFWWDTRFTIVPTPKSES